MYSGKSLGVVALLVFLLALPAYTQSYVYESSFLYLGDYPGNADPFYTVELQGITHDDDYWYITNQWNIFKFHISDDLDSSSPRDSKQLTTIAALNGYNHFGDLSHYKHNGQSYLVIAVEDNVGSLTHVIAVFKSSTLEFMGKAPLTGHISAACCGVDTAGNI